MKKSAGAARHERERKSVQRAAVQRGQQTGRSRAARGAQRVAKGRSGALERPAVSIGAAKPSQGRGVSVGVPYWLRRAFASGVVLLAGALLGLAALQGAQGVWNLPLVSAAATMIAPVVGAGATPTPAGPRVGLVSGHHGNDSGAVCPDGLTEAQVNFEVAIRVANQLRALGYAVDVLEEFDRRLKGYTADALVSIHADSCAVINDLATGFKVARVLDSKMPEREDRLVACLTAQYKRSTGLRFHANTVTFDMTQYHAFYEIDARTPAAIIETGFMHLDRGLLVEEPEKVAEGIADGIRCFVEGGLDEP